MKHAIRATLLAAALIAGTGMIAMAERDDDEGEGGIRPVTDPVVLKECGACHMAYQPGFLPAASWTKLMSGLKDHFGDNATLDAATAQKITDYLVANAADSRGRRTAPTKAGAEPPLRISELGWFRHEHGGRRGSPAALKRRGAKSLADCKACHQGAEKGYYDDD